MLPATSWHRRDPVEAPVPDANGMVADTAGVRTLLLPRCRMRAQTLGGGQQRLVLDLQFSPLPRQHRDDGRVAPADGAAILTVGLAQDGRHAGRRLSATGHA